jgi:MFS family permease
MGLAGYRRVLSAPRVLPIVSTSLLARLPGGMAGVALILFVHATSGSFGAAGIVAGGLTVGFGITGPLLGRLVDRRGSRLVMVPGAIVSAIALAAVVPLGEGGAGTVPMAAAAFVSGAATPPVSGILRQHWVDLVEPADLTLAYASDAILFEAIFIAGPLLAGVLAATAGADVGVIAAAALGLIGTLLFARLAPLGSPRDDGTARHWLGAIASPRLRLLVLAGVPLGAAFGAIDIALPAFGAHLGVAALGGTYLAATAVGSALGGIAYGARPGIFGPPWRALSALGVLMTILCLPLLAATGVVEMFLFAALAGLCVAPTITVRNQLLQTSAPAGTGTEAYTWLSLAMTAGASLGSALAGPLAEAAGWRAAAAVAVAMPAFGTVLLLARRRVFEERPPPVRA